MITRPLRRFPQDYNLKQSSYNTVTLNILYLGVISQHFEHYRQDVRNSLTNAHNAQKIRCTTSYKLCMTSYKFVWSHTNVQNSLANEYKTRCKTIMFHGVIQECMVSYILGARGTRRRRVRLRTLSSRELRFHCCEKEKKQGKFK